MGLAAGRDGREAGGEGASRGAKALPDTKGGKEHGTRSAIRLRSSLCHPAATVRVNKKSSMSMMSLVRVLQAIRLRKAFNRILVALNGHYRDTRDFPQPALQVAVTGGHNVAPVLCYQLHYLIIRIVGFSWNTFKSRIFGQTARGEPGIVEGEAEPEGDAILGAELLELRHDRIQDTRGALRKEAVHHALHNVQLVLNREVDEIRVDDDLVRGTELFIVSEEKGRALLHRLNNLFFAF